MMKELKEQYYERVIPLVGDTLTKKKIAIFNTRNCRRIIDLLASCRLRNFFVFDDEITNMEEYFKRKNNFEEWKFSSYINNNHLNLLKYEEPDLILYAGGQLYAEYICQLTKMSGIPSVIVVYLENMDCHSIVMYVTKEVADSCIKWLNLLENCSISTLDEVDWLDSSDMAAALAKAILLKGTKYERKDYNELIFNEGRRIICLGNDSWPWGIKYCHPEKDQHPFTRVEKLDHDFANNYIKDKKVLVLGCGSLGSLIALNLASKVRNLILVDSKEVSIFNPVRQAYFTSDIGKEKTSSLAKILSGDTIFPVSTFVDNILVEAINHERKHTNSSKEEWQNILDKYQPNLVIVTTGSKTDFFTADILRESNIPHIIGYCYPRAKFFETIFVIPNKTPCFNCLRGHLNSGKPFNQILTDEEANFIYEEGISPEEHERRMGDVIQEPATKIETGRVSSVITRLAFQMLYPPGLMANWIFDSMNKEKTCFVGGNYTIHEGDWAYNIKFPGQVLRYGVRDIRSSTHKCILCKRDYTRDEQ